MGTTAAAHPTDQTLRAYGLGKLDDALAESVSKHLEDCPSCQVRVAELSSDDFLGRLRNAQGSPEMPAANRSQVGGSNTDRGPAVAIAPPAADTMPPGLADHPDYEVIRELGRGGMGVVYLAQNKLMGRPEVLKVVGSHLIERPGVLDRFLREIRSAAKLQHKNIVTAYSALRLGESLVLAMEYVEGLDLAKMVKTKGPLPVAHACYFIHQAALGLQHAHERGMVHRDIKPANLILAREGKKTVVKVLDFGLAKVTSEGQADSGLTREGQMLGTPDYIAPEQIRDAQSADIRADIYSLGCTFYYLLTGGPPFRGDSLWDLYQAHFSMDAGPLNLVRPEVPVELAALVAKMMAKEPGRRFQTPGEVAQALTPFFKKGSVTVKGANPEVSQVGQPEATQSTPGAVSVPTRPAMERTPAPVSEARKPAPTQPGSILEGLIDIRETQPLFDRILDTPLSGGRSCGESTKLRPWSTAVEKLSRSGPRAWWAASGVLLLGLVVAWAAVVLRVKTANGTIVLENVPADAVVEVDGDRITVTPTVGEPVMIEVQAGKHVVIVKRGGDVLLGESVTLESGKQFKLTVSIVPPLPHELPKDDGQAPIKNSIGMTLKLIPAGEFLMGTTKDQVDQFMRLFPGSDRQWFDAEQPAHSVRLSKAFYLGIHEVTQGQYQAVMGDNPSQFKGSDDLPVENVSWLDAVTFCIKLSEREKRTPFYRIDGAEVTLAGGNGYRLPTEAEWEYACRAKSTTLYPFGDDAGKLGEHAWYSNNSDRKTHPVGQKLPNAWGLYDMLGNVWEWCADGYAEKYYASSPPADPPGAPRASPRVFRGGSWYAAPGRCRPAIRDRHAPAGRNLTRVPRGRSPGMSRGRSHRA